MRLFYNAAICGWFL